MGVPVFYRCAGPKYGYIGGARYGSRHYILHIEDLAVPPRRCQMMMNVFVKSCRPIPLLARVFSIVRIVPAPVVLPICSLPISITSSISIIMITLKTEGSPRKPSLSCNLPLRMGKFSGNFLMLSTTNEVSGSNELWNAFEEGDARKAQFCGAWSSALHQIRRTGD